MKQDPRHEEGIIESAKLLFIEGEYLLNVIDNLKKSDIFSFVRIICQVRSLTSKWHDLNLRYFLTAVAID